MNNLNATSECYKYIMYSRKNRYSPFGYLLKITFNSAAKLRVFKVNIQYQMLQIKKMYTNKLKNDHYGGIPILCIPSMCIILYQNCVRKVS